MSAVLWQVCILQVLCSLRKEGPSARVCVWAWLVALSLSPLVRPDFKTSVHGHFQFLVQGHFGGVFQGSLQHTNKTNLKRFRAQRRGFGEFRPCGSHKA